MQIQLACHPNSFGRFGPHAAIECLAELDIPSIEFPIKTAGVASPFGETPLLTNASSPEDVRQISQRVTAAGLKFSSCNITSGNPLQEGVLQATLTKLKMAADLGVTLVVSGGGELSTPEQEQALTRNLLEIAKVCESLGLTYCCETHPGACQNSRSMLHLMQQLQHPSIQINFDTANILYYNQDLDACDELLRVRPYVRHVHLKDSFGKYQDWSFPALGEGGAVDFPRIIAILQSTQFTGPCSLEIEGFPNEHELPLTAYKKRLADSVLFLKNLGLTW